MDGSDNVCIQCDWLSNTEIIRVHFTSHFNLNKGESLKWVSFYLKKEYKGRASSGLEIQNKQ